MFQEPTFYDKVGLLVLNNDHTAFLVCRKYPKHDFDSSKAIVRQYIMPWGTIEDGESHEDCLHREIDEELSTTIRDIEYVATYEAPAAGHHDGSKVRIALYQATLLDDPSPSGEIAELYRVGQKDLANDDLSDIIKHHILPDLIDRNLIISF